MTLETFLGLYFLIGLTYVLINGLIRKIYEADDEFLVLAHVILWFIFVLGLLIYNCIKLWKRLSQWTGKRWLKS